MGTWLSKDRAEIAHDLASLLELLHTEAVGEEDSRKAARLDLACTHLGRAIRRLSETLP